MRTNRLWRFITVCAAALAIMSGCGTPADSGMVTVPAMESGAQAGKNRTADPQAGEKANTVSGEKADSGKNETDAAENWNPAEIPSFSGLTFDRETVLSYAKRFRILYYKDGNGAEYTFIRVRNGSDVLLVPEEGAAPDAAQGIVLRKPVDRIYLAATASMSLFDRLDGLDRIRFSGSRAEDWYSENAKRAMEDGKILFAGKYSAPDFEKLIAENCELAVESTMILHVPEIREKLVSLGIPVFLDMSSYEEHPLGRTEWIRLYGALLGKEEQAETYFEGEATKVTELGNHPQTGKTAVIFYINSVGEAVVRNSDDYAAEMIRLAGGEYAFENLKNPNPENRMGSVHLSMEDFYAGAKDADYLIYNASIDSPLESVADLLQKSSLFADYRAVKEGHVYTTSGYFYQATDRIGQFIQDMNAVFMESGGDNLMFLRHLS